MANQQNQFQEIVQTTPAPDSILQYTDGTYNYYGFADPGASQVSATDLSWRWMRVLIAAPTSSVTALATWTGPGFNQNGLSPASKSYS